MTTLFYGLSIRVAGNQQLTSKINILQLCLLQVYDRHPKKILDGAMHHLRDQQILQLSQMKKSLKSVQSVDQKKST
ncbi:MAG: hypothetical protein R2911_25200 [Caldilineaceae bacterium]